MCNEKSPLSTTFLPSILDKGFDDTYERYKFSSPDTTQSRNRYSRFLWVREARLWPESKHRFFFVYRFGRAILYQSELWMWIGQLYDCIEIDVHGCLLPSSVRATHSRYISKERASGWNLLDTSPTTCLSCHSN